MKNTSKGVLVSIHCLVYNHEPYLRQCLDGFVMQKTNFLFEAIVHDDCSTDGSAAIIREYAEKYPDMIKPIFETTNQYSRIGFSGISKIMTVNSKGKYIAFCEGDDYWTDPYKLQKQVDYLESHPECGLVYTNSMIFEEKTECFKNATLPRQSDFSNILLESPIMTLTTCFKRDFFMNYLHEIPSNSSWMMADLPLWLYISSHSSIKYLPDVTSVYRKLETSASHSEDIDKMVKFCLSSCNIRLYFANQYNYSYLAKRIFINHFNELFKLSILYEKNLSPLIMRLAIKNHIYNIKIWLKCILYMSKFGRSYHHIRYCS